MSWKYLLELECEKEFAKLEGWTRNIAKSMPAPNIAPRILPPEEFVIQGLMPAPLPKPKPAPKRERCRECCQYDRRSRQCQIKRGMGLTWKGYCPKRFSRHSFNARFNGAGDLCKLCDFFDKVKRSCLIKRVNGEGCIYIVKDTRSAGKAPTVQVLAHAP